MNSYRIYTNVSIGEGCNFGDFASIGQPPRGYQDGELPTVLGNRVEIQSHATICAGNVVGDESIIGHGLFLRQNCRIGKRTIVGPHSILEWDVTIEDDVFVGHQAGIAEYTVIEQGVWIGAGVGIAGVLHPFCPKSKQCAKGPHLYRGVTVGSGVTIHPDLRIGEGSYIEPCSVVMRDVRPYTVVAGNPAKEIGNILTLYPGALERIERYLALSKDAIAESLARFEQEPSRFAAR